MEFPPPSGFLEGDFKDTRARGQESCCLTFCSETSFQEVLDREKPRLIPAVRALESKSHEQEASTGELWVPSRLGGVWAVRKGLAAAVVPAGHGTDVLSSCFWM